jgi:hypothetical protein
MVARPGLRLITRRAGYPGHHGPRMDRTSGEMTGPNGADDLRPGTRRRHQGEACKKGRDRAPVWTRERTLARLGSLASVLLN